MVHLARSDIGLVTYFTRMMLDCDCYPYAA